MHLRLLMCGMIAAFGTFGAQAITNGAIEGDAITTGTNPTGWSRYGGTVAIVAGARTGGAGTQYVRVINNDGPYPASLYQTEAGVDVGEAWTFSAWVRMSDTNTGAGFGWYQSVAPFAPGPNNVQTTGTAWTQYSVSQLFSANPMPGFRDAQISVAGDGVTGYADLDDAATAENTGINDWALF